MDNDDTYFRRYVVLYDPSTEKTAERASEIPRRLEKGDKIVTVGGIYGTVVEVKDRSLLIEVDNNVKIRVDKNSVVKDFSEAAQQ